MYPLYPCGVNKQLFWCTEAVPQECSIQLTGIHSILIPTANSAMISSWFLLPNFSYTHYFFLPICHHASPCCHHLSWPLNTAVPPSRSPGFHSSPVPSLSFTLLRSLKDNFPCSQDEWQSSRAAWMCCVMACLLASSHATLPSWHSSPSVFISVLSAMLSEEIFFPEMTFLLLPHQHS